MALPTEPHRETISIVLLGDFNPAIFQPLWFSANGLLPAEETERAEIAFIHKKVAIFSVGQLQIQVDESRLGITTVESPQEPILRDLAIGTLSILEHTPLKAIGLNLDSEFVVESESAWHEVGDRLVPKRDWKHVLEKPGMQQVVVQGTRSGCVSEHVNIRVQPTASKGILFAINQHYQLETKERTDVRQRNQEAIRVLREDWASFASYARQTALQLLQPDGCESKGEHDK